MGKANGERIPLLGSKSSINSSTQLLPQNRSKTTNYGLLHYSTGVDYLLIVFGFLASFIHGAGFPVLAIILGGMTTSFLRAQNSEFVVGPGNVDPKGLKPISQEEFNSQIGTYCIYYIALGVGMFITSYIQIACWESFSERVTHKLRQNYLKAILRQQIEWFDNEQTGNLTARLTDDLERVREGLGDKLSLFIQMLSAFFAGYGIGFFYSWSMTLVMMAIAPFIVLTGAYLSKIMATRTKVEQETYAVAGAIAEETFSSIRTVHSLNGGKQELNRFETALEKGRKTGIVKYIYMGISVGFSNFCMYASYALAFWYGSTLVINNPEIDRGIIFTVFFAVMSGSTALGSALPHLGSISTAKGAAHTVLRVINNHPYIDPYSLDGVTLTDVKGAITLHNVQFTYPSRPSNQILKGVSLEVKAGQKIALVGASGCGKSTIINLLLRFYDPSRGKIFIDGVELKDMNVHSLRENIALVSQEPVLFDGTLYENIQMGNENATHDQVVKACEMANAADFIKKLPDKYSTRVGERGVQLSGGQKQRIAIARALVKNPKILLLDEATSALDTEAEQSVQQALENAQEGRTTIIVAHRLATIRNADEIFVFQAGEIVERGTHEELIAKKGLFYDMINAQSLRAREAVEKKLDEDDISDRLSHGGSIRSRRSSGSQHRLSKLSMGSLNRKVSSVTSIHSLTKETEELQQAPSSIAKIYSFNRDNLGWLALGSCGAIVFGATTPIFALLYAQIFSVYSEPVDQMKSDVLFWCGMFLILGVTYFVSFFFSAYGLGHAGEALTKKLRLESFRNLLRQDIGFYDDIRHGTGKLCTRFATDAPNVRYVFTRMPLVISSIASVVGALVIGFIFGWQLALILLVMVPLLVASGYFEYRMQFGRQMRDTELLEEAGKVASQAVEHIRTVQAFNRQEQFNFMYNEYLWEPYKQNLWHAQSYAVVFAFSQSLMFFMYAVAFYLGSVFVNAHQMQPIDVYRVFFGISMCGQMVGNITSFVPDVVKARLAAALLFYLIEHPTEIDSLSEQGIRTKVDGDISLRHLFFNYPTRKHTKVLQGLSLEIKAGQTVALVGHSGCGKSTVMALLERFYNPARGTIVCIVSQEPILFDCTIGDNIRYGLDTKPSHEEIVRVAQMANIHNFILGLPNGYDTRVGEKGTQLSGGQKQRIAIARALIRNPKILLLDEATSALDTPSEKIVQEALEVARQGRTCLTIAHRLSTIQNSDVIAVVEEGKIVDKGTHQQLLARNTIYQKLCETQRLVENQ